MGSPIYRDTGLRGDAAVVMLLKQARQHRRQDTTTAFASSDPTPRSIRIIMVNTPG